MSSGFALAKSPSVRFDIRGAVDIDRHANRTYERALGTRPLGIDIRSLLKPRQLEAAKRHWGLDARLPLVLVGCAPCQGFSSHRKKDKREDGRDSLVDDFAKIAVRLRPDVIVTENVPELLSRKHWDHFRRWKTTLTRAGYHVRARIYNLAGFGVAQERFRAVAIAAKDWRYFSMPEPTTRPEDYETVRRAIGHLPPLEAGGVDPHDAMHLTSRHRAATVRLLSLIPKDGGSHRDLPPGVGPACFRKVDGFRDVYGRLAWDKPAVSITARCRTPSCGRFTHPEQNRGLSVREAALLQGFPARFMFEGPFDDKFKQIGNAVSPIFSKTLAECVANQWFLDHNNPALENEPNLDVRTPVEKSFSSMIASLKRKSTRILGAEVR